MRDDARTTVIESPGLPARTAVRAGDLTCSLTWVQGDLAALETALALEETVCRWDLWEVLSKLGYCATG